MNEIIKELLRENNGIIKASAARLAGVDNKVLQRLEDRGELKRIIHGLYVSAEHRVDEYAVAQYRCGKGVFSHETALFLHKLIDSAPLSLMITIPNGYNSRLLQEKDFCRFFYCKPELHTLGVITMQSPFGNEIRVYDQERTICDCIQKRKKLDSGIVLSAVNRYIHTHEDDHTKLFEYAAALKIHNTVTQYIEILR